MTSGRTWACRPRRRAMRRSNALFRIAAGGLSVFLAGTVFGQGRGGRGAAPLPPITHPERDGPDLTGVYQLVPHNVTLPGGLKNQGGPDEVPLGLGSGKAEGD